MLYFKTPKSASCFDLMGQLENITFHLIIKTVILGLFYEKHIMFYTDINELLLHKLIVLLNLNEMHIWEL